MLLTARALAQQESLGLTVLVEGSPDALDAAVRWALVAAHAAIELPD
jgi:hypothetical protein